MLKKRKQKHRKSGDETRHYEVIGKAVYVEPDNPNVQMSTDKIHEAFRAFPFGTGWERNAEARLRTREIVEKKVDLLRKGEHGPEHLKKCEVELREEGEVVENLIAQPAEEERDGDSCVSYTLDVSFK